MSPLSLPLQSKVALVTGGADDVGEATVRALLRNGAIVVLTDSRELRRPRRLAVPDFNEAGTRLRRRNRSSAYRSMYHSRGARVSGFYDTFPP